MCLEACIKVGSKIDASLRGYHPRLKKCLRDSNGRSTTTH